MAVHNESILALFFLTPQELKRVVDCQNKAINPFAGLLAFQEDQKPVAIQVKGANNIFASNRVANMYSFSTSPGSSFIILDHVQEGKDQQGVKRHGYSPLREPR